MSRTAGVILFSSLLFLVACNSNYTAGKTRGYFKIDFPQKAYQQFNQPGYPYSFEYPVYGRLVKDSTFFESTPENDWWINIDFPQFAARVHMSYKEIGKYKFEELVNDAYKLSYKQHTHKASRIDDSAMVNPAGIPGVYFTLRGNTATSEQFFLTDSVKHFLRGALYFAATPNEDSISIVNNFLRQDLLHMINSFRWK